MSTYFWPATVASDVVNPVAEQIAYLLGQASAPDLPFVSLRPARSLTTKHAAANNFGTYSDRIDGAGPDPRTLGKAPEVEALEYMLHGSTVLSQKAQIAMAMAMTGGFMQYLQSMGQGFGWTLHEKIIDLIANNARSGTWQTTGTSFASTTVPSKMSGVYRPSRLASALDMTALKATAAMHEEMINYDGTLAGRRLRYVLVPSTAGADTIELCNALTKTPGGTQSFDSSGYGYAGPSFVGNQGYVPISTASIDDDDMWLAIAEGMDLIQVLTVAAPRPKFEILPGTEDVILSDNPIIQILVPDNTAFINGGPS